MNNFWGAVVLAGLVAWGAMACYDAGRESRQQEVVDADQRADELDGTVKVLQSALSSANAKILAIAQDKQAADAEKARMLESEKDEAVKAKKRVEAAKAVTSNADDVLRTYWESYGK